MFRAEQERPIPPVRCAQEDILDEGGDEEPMMVSMCRDGLARRGVDSPDNDLPSEDGGIEVGNSTRLLSVEVRQTKEQQDTNSP